MQSRRGSWRERFSSSPPVRASTGGASSFNASGRLWVRATRSVTSRSSRYRSLSGEAIPSSPTLVSGMHTPPAPAAYDMSRGEILSRNWGSAQLANLRDYSSTLRCPQASVPFLGNQSYSPPVGEPPSGSAALFFPDWCLPGKDIVTQSTGNRQVIPSYTTHKLRGKIPQMARGWESKSVEQQQEEMSEPRKTVRAPVSSDEQQRNRKREGLLLSRKRLTQQLHAAGTPRHRQMLEQAIAELDRQLSSFK